MERDYLENNYNIHGLREMLVNLGGTPGAKNKEQLIDEILMIESGELKPTRSKIGRPNKNLRGGNECTIKDSECDACGEVCGVLEILSDGYGFIRAENYSCSIKDAFIAKPTIKENFLREGDLVLGKVVFKRENQLPEMREVISVNGLPPKKEERPRFDDLVPRYPDERLTLGTDGDLSLRLIDMFSPIGKGQRALIVAPPKTGKTTLLKKIAQSLEKNHPDIKLIVLLVDERPEEVTDFKEGINGEVVFSTFDEEPSMHVRISELLLARARSLVESGNDVVVLVDSITKLTRAYNSTIPASGKTLSGGIDPQALVMPKRFFGSARKTSGGSLTVIATALVETGSRMDDVIFEEFKGTGNMEVVLSRELANRRIFPAIDVLRSGTRKEELLLSADELECSYKLRKIISGDQKNVEGVFNTFMRTSSNADLAKKVDSLIRIASEGYYKNQ